jgi:hypothetical protein
MISGNELTEEYFFLLETVFFFCLTFLLLSG